jgi:hypothetical protein
VDGRCRSRGAARPKKYSYRAIDPIEISDLGGAVETEERGSNEK